jgi:hypothetical protein
LISTVFRCSAVTHSRTDEGMTGDSGLNTVWNNSQSHSSGPALVWFIWCVWQEHFKLENDPRAKPGGKIQCSLKTCCKNCHFWCVVTLRITGSEFVQVSTLLTFEYSEVWTFPEWRNPVIDIWCDGKSDESV